VNSLIPNWNKVTFTKRVNGVDSDDYLADNTQNGIYPKEHWIIVNGLGTDPVKNRGWFSGLDVGGSTGSLPVSGDIASAIAEESGNNSKVTVTMANAMDSMNYKIRMDIEGESASIYSEGAICGHVFKKISTTVFQFGIREFTGEGQNLKIHIEAVQL